jgi:outer membrane immunogenic protein
MKTWKWAVAAAAVLGLAAQASAADLKMPVKAAGATSHQVQAHNWTGFYIGAFGGYHDGKITQSGCVGLCPVDPKITGGLFGIQAGYDYQFQNNIVLGVFGWVPLTRPKTTISIGPGLDT